MELLEKNAVIPSFLDLGDLISRLLSYFFRIDSLRHGHYLQRIRFQEESKCITTYLSPCQLIAPHHTMRSCLQVPSSVDLSGLAELESQHISRNADLSHIGKAVLGIESTSFKRELDLFTALVSIEGRSEGSEGSVIIMPSTPIVLSVSLVLKGEVVQHAASVALSLFDNAM